MLFQRVETFRNAYPEHDIFADIGDGWDWRRSGLIKLMRKVMNDELYEVVVFHENDLSTSAYNHIATVFQVHHVRLTKIKPDSIP